MRASKSSRTPSTSCSRVFAPSAASSSRRRRTVLIETAELVERIWQRDPSVWTGVDVDDVVLLGMGGSSLAPEVMRRQFGAEDFHVLDTTHPAAIRRLEESITVERTLFLAA